MNNKAIVSSIRGIIDADKRTEDKLKDYSKALSEMESARELGAQLRCRLRTISVVDGLLIKVDGFYYHA